MTRKNNAPRTGRDFHFTPAGDDVQLGTAPEVALAKHISAVDRVNALDPQPSGAFPASINSSVTGTYSEGIVVPKFTTANCKSASILSTDSILVECGGNHTVEWGSLFAFSAFATCIKIPNRKRTRVVINSCVVPEDGIGFDVSGADSDEVFIDLVEGVMLGPRATMLKHTATSPTPIVYRISDAVFSDVDQIFMEYDPGVSSSETIVKMAAIQPMTSAFSTSGSMIFKAMAGTLSVTGDVLQAETIATVLSGAVVVVDANAVFGNTIVEAGGNIVYKSVGAMSGSVDLQGAGAIAQVQTESLVGDFTVAAGAQATLKTDVIVGNIDVGAGGRLFCIIDTQIGTVTPSDPSDGRINGIINGIRYGNWQNRRETEVLLLGESFLDQNPSGLDNPLMVEFGAAQGSGSDPVQISSAGLVTANESGQYICTIDIQMGRGGAGGAAWLFSWLEKNGTQIEGTRLRKLDTANEDNSLQFSKTLDLVATDELTFMIVRDSQGMDVGGLVSETPTIAINPSASARITIERSVLK